MMESNREQSKTADSRQKTADDKTVDTKQEPADNSQQTAERSRQRQTNADLFAYLQCALLAHDRQDQGSGVGGETSRRPYGV
jgi:hypothetical protein